MMIDLIVDKGCRWCGGTDVSYGILVQQMYGSNGASVGLPMGMTTLKGTGTLGTLGNYGSGIAPGVTGATTLPRPGNWLRPAGLRLGHSAARVRLYCQAKWGVMVPTGELYTAIRGGNFFLFRSLFNYKKKIPVIRALLRFYFVRLISGTAIFSLMFDEIPERKKKNLANKSVERNGSWKPRKKKIILGSRGVILWWPLLWFFYVVLL